MKIGIEVSTLGKRTTGTNRYLSCLLEQLESTQNEIVRLSPGEKGFLGLTSRKKESSLKRHLYRNFLLTNELVESGVDCAIFPDYFMPQGFKRPSAVVIHDLSFISHPHFYSQKFVRYYNYQIKQTLKQDPLIISVSEHTSKNIKKYLGVKEENIFVVQGYSNISGKSLLNSLHSVPSRPYLLYLGHIEPRKNIPFMIEGFLRWKKENRNDYKLKIVGALWISSPEINLVIKKYFNHPDIEFSGYVDENLLHEIFSNASGFIHTSFEEGFGFPVLEAMHYGLPILCTNDIATKEISGMQSVSISPYDVNDYLTGLDKLSQKIISENKIKYKIKYSSFLMKEQLGNLLDKLNCRVKKIYASKIPKAKTKTEALEKTFIYSSLFNAGIRKETLHKQIFDVEIGKEELHNFINLLILQNIIKEDQEVIYLNNLEEGFYRNSKKKINRKKLMDILNFLDRLPFVSGIAFSGGTTHYGLENHDDIDLFIITKPYALYLVYAIIHIYSILADSRKELCVNYLVDENGLHVNHSYDFYTAHQIISLTAYKNYRMLNKFWNENQWVRNFYPNFYSSNDIPKRASLPYYLLKPINKLLMSLYRKMYKTKLRLSKASNSVLLTEHTIKIHTNDHRNKIIKEFEAAWEAYSKQENIIPFVKTDKIIKTAAS